MKIRLFCLLICMVWGFVPEIYGKDAYKILLEYRTDISPAVIKKAKKWGSDPIIHDSWIENPWGKSIDLQGNVMFPDLEYVKCKEITPILFELKKDLNVSGVVRSDGTVIIPFKHHDFEYFPDIDIIVGFDEKIYQGYDKATLYDYYGNVIKEIPGATIVHQRGDDLSWSGRGLGSQDIDIPKRYSAKLIKDVEAISTYYYQGPQAATFNIIRNLCTSKKESDYDDAMELMRYYIDYIMPKGKYYRNHSLLLWELRFRYLSMMHLTKVNDKRMKEADEYLNFVYEGLIQSGYKPSISGSLYDEVKSLASSQELEMIGQTKELFDEAIEICKQKIERKAALNSAILAALQVMTQATSNMAQGNQTATYNNAAAQTGKTTVPASSGEMMIDKTSLSPELMGMAIMNGYTPDTSPTTTETTTKTSTSSSTPTRRICHACYGRGIHQVCRGSGQQLAWGNKRIEKCSGCHGTGKCPQCNGGYH